MRNRLAHYSLTRNLDADAQCDTWIGETVDATGARRQVLLRLVELGPVDPRRLPTLLAEARLTAYLRDSRVARVVDYGCADGYFFLAVEWIDGPSLAAILDRCNCLGQRFPLRMALHVLREICLALKALHGFVNAEGAPEPLTYPGLSLRRVMVTRGSVRLCDQVIRRAFTRDLDRPPPSLDDDATLMARDLQAVGSLGVGLLGWGDPTAGDDIVTVADLQVPEKVRAVLRRLEVAGMSDGFATAEEAEDAIGTVCESMGFGEQVGRLASFVDVLFGTAAKPSGFFLSPSAASSVAAADTAAAEDGGELCDDLAAGGDDEAGGPATGPALPPLRAGGQPRDETPIGEEERPTVEQRSSRRAAAAVALSRRAGPQVPPEVVEPAHFLAAYRKGELAEVILFGEGRITIGCLEGNDIVASGRSVQAYHAHLTTQAGRAFVVDLSTGTTLVNGKPVVSVELVSGDRVRVGDIELVYDPPGELMVTDAAGTALMENLPGRARRGRIDPASVPTRILGMRAWASLREIVDGEVLDHPIRGLLSCIGADLGNDIILDGPSLQPRHAVIRLGPSGSVSIRPGDQWAQIVLNGRQITSEAPLAGGDEVRMGGRTLLFVRHEVKS